MLYSSYTIMIKSKSADTCTVLQTFLLHFFDTGTPNTKNSLKASKIKIYKIQKRTSHRKSLYKLKILAYILEYLFKTLFLTRNMITLTIFCYLLFFLKKIRPDISSEKFSLEMTKMKCQVQYLLRKILKGQLKS